MPVIKCHHGCSLHVSTPEWVATLTIDQLRYAREAMDAKIKAVEESQKRTVWRLCRGGACEANYREDDFEKAADHLLRIFKSRFMREADDWIEKPYGYLYFERNLPRITPELVSQIEYDTEWFPAKL
ncbi:hypothetical protein [Pseudomonas lundensis]|uniref:Uncharacterized protein n=1 Tax=Pseudomonas lundensis TaxID=86185 RepID=A0ABX4GIV7_9PSED|nr:hypothetical protein [Pseudomonas lundensis]OZY26568.1 hypothetical protein CJF40_19110 [Pseudomonas lundensis]OZY45217.1 hypothetical protein CJF41_16150 [Pseudomonas lundensis]OZY54063.1 hypothetical protein CJF38_16470 [Pseudomonas lundensis]